MSYATIIWSWTFLSDPFDTGSNGFWTLCTIPLVRVEVCYVMPYALDANDSIELVIFGYIQIWGCAFHKFRVELIHECLLDICHLCNLGVAYPNHASCWPLCENDFKWNWKFAWHSNTTHPKHLLWEYLVGDV